MLTRDRIQDLYERELEELRRRFDPDNKRGMISLAKAADYLGADYRSVQEERNFPVATVGKQNRVTLVGLAWWLANREVS